MLDRRLHKCNKIIQGHSGWSTFLVRKQKPSGILWRGRKPTRATNTSNVHFPNNFTDYWEKEIIMIPNPEIR